MISWYKNHKKDKVWWKDNDEKIGELVFSFDKVIEFNFWQDYPHKLTPEQKAIFDAENEILVRDLKGQS
ncbi:hypothetical protein Q7267_11345 [Glaesserella parasuis]|uniref:DUF7675 domain-containing protein n=2 Tax=Glaesserella parasuis TaxID=738 RepID=A0A859IG89_GLAPU|nr:hypothetical protein [Glaesserella parasuis]AWY45439.1 hypothetical protein B4U42_05390 [Glaesserella parasuis 29755]EQA96066.1 hypothetical protein HPS_0379 [Glaesserella parasuis 29755]KDB45409.1 hypothetical protein HPS9_07895 [Glaesserella parasuis HPS9]KDD80557.1 hypothetical protein HPS42_07360 [Glaesserella parasuis ST4-2]MCT8547875.1 hypothetical protein [Glaesserella parasuis]